MSLSVCPHCGQSHREGARFCPVTGKLLSVEAAVSPPQAGSAGVTGKLPENTILRGRYLIYKKVGQGGMAAVYQAYDTQQPGMLWAIKEMSDTALPEKDRAYAVQCFQREASLLLTLSHPNLPKVIEAFNEGQKHYLVMEFISGKTMQSLLSERTQPFTEAEVLPWAIQLCDVLHYLHSQTPKIIFRDLKPSNIMLTPQGQVKLIDFGIARFFKPEKDKDTMALGTPGYSALEALGGQTDERSDIYSLCVTLYQLLTLHDPLRTPFNLPPIRKLNSQVSPEMERILATGVHNQREMRWKTAQELKAELIRLRGVPIPKTVVAGSPASSQQPMVESVVQSYPIPDSAESSAGGGGLAGAIPQTPKKPSRPTQRLVMEATRLRGWQVALLVGGAFLLLVLGTWLLAEPLAEMGISGNRVPIFALFGALGFSAYPKRFVAFISQALLSTALVATLWLRIGTQGYEWTNLIIAALVSGAFMELWVALLPRIRGAQGSEAWLREALWLMLMAVIGTTLFLGITTEWVAGLDAVQWLISAIFGLLGWFLGDLFRQYIFYRRTGMWVRV